MDTIKGKRKTEIITGRVKELRKDKNITQQKLAEDIEVSTNTISRIERKQINLSSNIALRIARKYNVSLDWLFCLSDEKDLNAFRDYKRLHSTMKFIDEAASEKLKLTPPDLKNLLNNKK